MSSDLLRELQTSLYHAHPELLLVGFSLIFVVVGAWFGQRSFGVISALGVITLAAAGVLAVVERPLAPLETFSHELVVDGVGVFAKALIAFSAAFNLALGWDYFTKSGEKRFEFPVLVVLSVLGMFVMVSARDLIALYVGVELQSLAAYVLAAWRRDETRSSEAGLKYFVLSALSSGLLLYGASFIYGFTGSVRFDDIANAVSQGAGLGVIFGLVLMLCALGFKMSAAPFHMWTPDVYEGAPTPLTAFFAAAPKVAAVALMARLLYGPFASIAGQWEQVIEALAAISMVLGSFAALLQTNLKRLMAYSSIGNMGFALMGLASGRADGATAALLYLALYLPATIGIFALILAMRRDGQAVETIDDLAGTARQRPLIATLFTALLFSIAGVPPLAGFFGKYIVFLAAVNGGQVWLAVVGGVSAVVAAAYYLRIVAAIWFKPAGPALQPASGAVLFTATTATALTFPVLVVALGWLQTWAEAAVRSGFGN